MLLISLGVTLGLFLAYQGYKYFLSGRKKKIFVPRIVLHSVENFVTSGEIFFHFEVREQQDIVFEVCNENFEPVLELQNKTLEDGSYTLPFNTAVIPNGEYFYRLRGAEHHVMKKFVVQN